MKLMCVNFQLLKIKTIKVDIFDQNKIITEAPQNKLHSAASCIAPSFSIINEVYRAK